jgi:hypothetical protein
MPFMMGRDGRIAGVYEGVADWLTLERDLQRALAP